MSLLLFSANYWTGTEMMERDFSEAQSDSKEGYKYKQQ